MKRILIDIDDTITDQDGYLYLVNKFLKTNYTINDVKGYYIQDLVPKEKMDDYTNYFVTEDTYKYCNIYPNCKDVMKKLNDNYEVYICSSYVYRDNIMYSADALKYKFEFLIKNFPFLNPNNFMFASNKSIIDCDIKIDDKIEHLENAKIKLLYTAYHNKNITDEELKEKGIIRVNNWLDIENILLKQL